MNKTYINVLARALPHIFYTCYKNSFPIFIEKNLKLFLSALVVLLSNNILYWNCKISVFLMWIHMLVDYICAYNFTPIWFLDWFYEVVEQKFIKTTLPLKCLDKCRTLFVDKRSSSSVSTLIISMCIMFVCNCISYYHNGYFDT